MSTRASSIAELEPQDELPPEEIQDEPEYLPRDEMDDVDENADPYDADGNARWENPETGEPVDFHGNVIPAVRAQVEEPEDVAPVVPPPAPQRQVYRSPFSDGIFTDQEQERYDAILDAESQALIDKRVQEMAKRTYIALRQQGAAARDLGIPEDRFNEVSLLMEETQAMVPENLLGTKAGANIALAAALVRKAGSEGSIFDLMRELTTTSAPVQPAVQPRQPVPAMSPSQRSVQARPAPDSTRGNRGPKMIGTLTQEQMAIIRAERKTTKNGR